MIRALLFLAWASVAAAAPLGEGDAVRIGREANVQGMRALIAQRDQGLLFRAVNAWSIGEELPPQLEALAVEYYADPVAQRPLIGRLGQQIDVKTHARHPRYRSRKLFDLMYADLKAGREPHHYAIRIVCTDLAVEAELMALLPVLPVDAADEIVNFLGSRRYAAAVPALQALHARVPHERNVNQMIEHVDWAWLQIGTPEAIRALLARLQALGTMPDERAGYEVWNILVYVNQLAPGRPPSFAELDAALPAQLNASAWRELVKLITARKEKAGIPRLLRAVAESPQPGEAVDALIAIGEPADWSAARAALGERDKAALARIDAALASPAQARAQREERERRQAEERAQREYHDERQRIAAYKAADPARYGAEMKKLLQREASRMRPEDLARAYESLGTFYRFTLRQPDEALALYAQAGARRPANSLDVAALDAADTLRFDKRDTPRAIEQYRRAARAFTAPNAREARLLGRFQRWIDAEVAYLQQGRRFSGSLDAADLEMAFLWLGLAAEREPLVPPPDAASLSRLPASQLQIGRAMPSVFDLAPTEMLAFFEKHDPAGYLTAAVLALAVTKEPSPYVKAAAESFFRQRGVHTPSTATADARFATPEKTWASFLAAAKKGDAAGILACFTEDMRARLEPAFTRLSAQELRQIGASFVGFAMQDRSGQTAEAVIARQDKDQRRAGFVTFVRDGAGWKIASM